MRLLLQRYSDNGQATAGLLFLLDEVNRKLGFLAHTLEDEKRAVKVRGETRIKAGLYELGLQMTVTPMTERYREKYGWFHHFIMVLKVEGFTGIYLHNGTREKDTDGCLLTANQALAAFSSEGAVLDHLLAQSTDNMKMLYEIIVPKLEAGEKVHLEIRDELTN